MLVSFYKSCIRQARALANKQQEWNLSFLMGIRMATVFCLMICLIGCGSAKKAASLKNLVPIEGTVSFNGQPIPGAILTFHASETDLFDAKAMTSAIVDQNGKFVVHTSSVREIGSGAPPGDYKVAISWTKPDLKNDGESGPELLPTKYQHPKTSGVEIVVASGKRQSRSIELTP